MQCHSLDRLVIVQVEGAEILTCLRPAVSDLVPRFIFSVDEL